MPQIKNRDNCNFLKRETLKQKIESKIFPILKNQSPPKFFLYFEFFQANCELRISHGRCFILFLFQNVVSPSVHPLDTTGTVKITFSCKFIMTE